MLEMEGHGGTFEGIALETDGPEDVKALVNDARGKLGKADPYADIIICKREGIQVVRRGLRRARRRQGV